MTPADPRPGLELVEGPGDLALDEALVRALDARIRNTRTGPGPAGGTGDAAPPSPVRPRIRVWHTGPAVLLGRNQEVGREVFAAACRADGVGILRRCSGGGTVYTDPGDPNVSLVLPGSVLDPVDVLGEVMRRALAGLGLESSTTRRGVFVADRKISGFAALRLAGATLVHCTLLVDTPADTIWRYLRPAPAEPGRFDSHRSPVTSLRALLGTRAPDAGELRRALVAAAAARFGPAEPRPASAGERDWEQGLGARRYDHAAWHLTGRDARLAS